MSKKVDLKRAAYIALSGYGPCSMFTLKEWLEARDLFRANQDKAYTEIGIKPYNPV